LVARYKDVVITLEGRFCTEDFSRDAFFEIAKKIDLIATENITVCKKQ
jgi:hypothetical protein